jgi:hypothetical protein
LDLSSKYKRIKASNGIINEFKFINEKTPDFSALFVPEAEQTKKV